MKGKLQNLIAKDQAEYDKSILQKGMKEETEKERKQHDEVIKRQNEKFAKQEKENLPVWFQKKEEQ